MPRASTLAERRRRKRIDAIVDAALDLFSSQGYAAVTMAAIGEAVDLTPTALYRYFPSKQALLDYCMENRLRVDPLEDDSRLRDTIRSDSLPEEIRGRALLASNIMTRQLPVWALLVREVLAQDPDATARYRQVRDVWLERLNRLTFLHPGRDTLPGGEGRLLAAASTYLVLGCTLDLMLTGEDGRVDSPLLDGPTPVHVVLEDLLDLLIRGYREEAMSPLPDAVGTSPGVSGVQTARDAGD